MGKKQSPKPQNIVAFYLSVEGIIKYLKLTGPIYFKTASYGHFGFNTAELPWEQVKEIS